MNEENVSAMNVLPKRQVGKLGGGILGNMTPLGAKKRSKGITLPSPMKSARKVKKVNNPIMERVSFLPEAVVKGEVSVANMQQGLMIMGILYWFRRMQKVCRFGKMEGIS